MKGLKQLSEIFIKFIGHLFIRQTSSFFMIFGRRESGKTDFALLIAEILHAKGIIKHFATNIKIYSSKFEIKRITDLEDLKEWCKTNKGKKLFIFDEVGKSVSRRKPMSSLNVKMINQLQILRKYKLSIIGITVNEKYADSAVLGSDVLDGYFEKPNFKNPKVGLFTDFLEDAEKSLTDIPPTSIEFDTWDVAPFTEFGKDRKPKFKEKELQILWEWSHGKGYKDLGLHPMQVNRLTRKFIRKTLESKVHGSQG
jgi:hypothetical protein